MLYTQELHPRIRIRFLILHNNKSSLINGTIITVDYTRGQSIIESTNQYESS